MDPSSSRPVSSSQGFNSAPARDLAPPVGLQVHPSRLAHLEQGQQQSTERDAVKKEETTGGWGAATTNGGGGGW
jgi:hypothetical protein